MENNSVIWNILFSRLSVAVYGTTVGLFFNFLFKDYIRPYFSSIRSIRDRLKSEKPINKREEKKISKYASNRLDEWISKFKSPNKELKANIKSKFIALPYDASNTTTKCPSSKYFVFFDSTNFLGEAKDGKELTGLIDKFILYLTDNDLDGTSKQLFNNLHLKSKLSALTIWLRLPSYLVDSKEKLNKLYNKVDSVVKTWFPNSKLKIELFIPQLILPKAESIKINEFKSFPDFTYLTGKRTFLQDYAASVFKKKCIFGKLELDDEKRIPPELILRKIQKQNLINSSKITEIIGPPGSGKTEILDYIIKNSIPEFDNSIIICFNSHDELSSLNRFNHKYDSFMDYILEIVDLNERFDCSKEDLIIIKNTLKLILKKRSVKILLVIDNLEYTEKLYSDIELFLSSNVFDNVSFLISSRYILKKNKNKLPTSRYVSQLWTYEESLKIVEYWMNNSDCIKNRHWLKSNKSFSTYFLRIISSTNENFEPDELVRKEINSILKPILKSVDSARYSSDEQLAMIRKLIKKEDLTKESVVKVLNKEQNINIIKVFGNITLNRIYNQKNNDNNEQYGLSTNIIPERVINWSNKMIPDQKTAEKFVRACKAAGIIKDYNLTDKLIQDATAAITIQEEYISKYLLLESDGNADPHELNRIEALIHDIITKLSKKNSLEIFKISFRIDHLMVIINSIIDSNRDKGILNELLTTDYIKYLSRNPDNIDIILLNLIKAFDHKELSINDKICVGLCISRIVEENKNAKAYLNENINSKQRMNLVSCVFSHYYLDDKKLFDFKSGQIDQNILFDFCCLIWTSKGSIIIFDKFIELSNSHSFDKLIVSLFKWINRQSTKDIIEFCDSILYSLSNKVITEKEVRIRIAAKVLSYLFSNRLAVASKKEFYMPTLDKWGNQMKKLIFSGMIEISKLIEILGYGYNHDLVDLKQEHKIIADKANNKIFVIPKKQFEKEKIHDIFSNFKHTKYFDLPSSKLLKYVYKNSDGKELISDYLTAKNIKYVPFPHLYPNEHKYFETQKVIGMKINDIKETKFGWRPIFKL